MSCGVSYSINDTLDSYLCNSIDAVLFCCRLDEIIVFRQLTKGEVKQIADIMLGEVFKRAEEKEIKIDVTERFKVSCDLQRRMSVSGCAVLQCSAIMHQSFLPLIGDLHERAPFIINWQLTKACTSGPTG